MRKIILKLFDAQTAPPLLFLAIIYLIGVTTNTLSDAIIKWTGLGSGQVTVVGLFMLLTIMILLNPLPRFINYLIRGRGKLISSMGSLPERHKGLIVLCSVGENIPAEQAIRYHYKGLNNEHEEPVLKHCWMLTGGDTSLTAAKRLIEKLKLEGFPENLFETIKMSGDDADNPAKVYEIVDGIYKNLPNDFSESDVIADYTGGTKSMTAGLILACAIPERKLEVLKPREYKEDGTADRTKGSDPKLIDIRFRLKQV